MHATAMAQTKQADLKKASASAIIAKWVRASPNYCSGAVYF